MTREGVNANQIYASGFPDTTSESDLYLYFGSYGEVTTVKLLINKKKNTLIGAFVTFRDCRCADMVIEDQKRRQMYFNKHKIHVREAYADKQTTGRGDYQRQASGGAAPVQAAPDRRGYPSDRDERQQPQAYSSGGGYERGYSGGVDVANKAPYYQQSAYPAAAAPPRANVVVPPVTDNRAIGGYSSGTMAATPGYSVDRRSEDSYATRRDDSYNQAYSSQGSRAPSYNDSYSRPGAQTSYTRQDNGSLDSSRRFDDRSGSGYQEDFNRSASRLDGSFTGGDTSRVQSGSGSWAEIMDREDRYTDRRPADRSYERRDTSMAGDAYSRDSNMAARRSDGYTDSYNRDNRSYDRPPPVVPVYDANRSGAAAQGGYDTYSTATRAAQPVDAYRSERPAPAPAAYVESPRYPNEPPPVEPRYREAGMDRPVAYGREQEMPPPMNRSANYVREPERFDDRESRKRGPEWVGGYEDSPRKQMAIPDRDDRPSSYPAREQGVANPFIQSLNRSYESRPDVPEPYVGGPTPGRDDPMARGPGATSTPREARTYDRPRAMDMRESHRGARDFNDRRDPKSGFVGGPDRKDRPSGRGRGGARRDSPRGGVNAGPNARQPINQGRLQMDRRHEARPSDRRGWVGGGSLDAAPMMSGNMSPQSGMGMGVEGGMMQSPRVMLGGGMPNQQVQQAMMQQQQQQQQMEMMKMRQQQNMMQQRGGSMMGAQQGGGNMQGIMSTLASLLQNMNKGRGNTREKQQVEYKLMRQLRPLEMEVIGEVKRSLKVDETALFASAIMMMRPMDDEVMKFFTQLPQGILTKILRGASPEVIAMELAKVRNTKSYDNREEARFHVLRKLCIVLYKVSREQVMPRPLPPPIVEGGPIRSLVGPRDLYRQRLLLAKRRLAVRGGREAGFVRGRGGLVRGRGGFVKTTTTTTKSGAKTEAKKTEDAEKKNGKEVKKEDIKEEPKTEESSTRGRGGFRRGFGVRGRGNFRGRGGYRGRGAFRGRGGHAAGGKPNGEVKKPTETKKPEVKQEKVEVKQEKPATAAPVKKAPQTPVAKKPAPKPAEAKKTTPTPAVKAAATPVAKKVAPVKKVTPVAAKKAAPAKPAAAKATPAKTAVKTPLKK